VAVTTPVADTALLPSFWSPRWEPLFPPCAGYENILEWAFDKERADGNLDREGTGERSRHSCGRGLLAGHAEVSTCHGMWRAAPAMAAQQEAALPALCV